MKTVKKGLSRGLSILLTLLMVLSLTVVGMVSSSAAQVDIADSGWSGGEPFYVQANINGSIATEQMNFVSEGGKNDTGYFTQTFTTTQKNFEFRVRLMNNAYLIPNQSNYEVVPAEDTEGSLWLVKKEDGSHLDRFFRLNCSSFSSDTIDVTINVKISGGNITDLTYKVKSSGGSTGGGSTGGGSTGGGETTTMRTFTEGEYIYIKNSKFYNVNWIVSNGVAWAHLYNSDSNVYCDMKFELCEGTGEAGAENSYYRAKITKAGTYDKITFTRNSSNSQSPFDNTLWNKTGDISIPATDNCYTDFVAEGATCTTLMYTPTGGGSGSETASMWVDVVADKNYDVTNIDRIYPTKNGSEYVFYLPSSVDINNLSIQHNCESLTIGGNTIDGTARSYTVGTSYTLSDGLNGTVKFYQSANVAALYTYTEESMPTTTKGGSYTKGDYNTTGTIMKIGADGAIDVDETNLKSIKGRGNSSWQASAEHLGKYAYNISLKSEDISLIEGAKANKKYSLLANNMDESRMRNMVIYNLATEVGVKYTSKFETFDVYNNGLYMGSYLLAEKVEVGDPLVNIVDLEAINEDANTDIYDKKSQVKTTTSDTMYASNLVEPAASSYQDSGFLLEFEYSDRYNDEFSGFISKEGQHIVCKSPEYATLEEIKFIRDKWNKAEEKMYNTNATYNELNDFIDVESFAKMYLIQELSKNLDAGCTSYYVYYDGGKFHAGVAWDYDWTLGQYGEGDKAGYYPTVTPTRFSEVNSELSDKYGWHVNSKKMDKPGTNNNKFNAQAQLCQNENFWAVVAAEWNENFYSKALSYTEPNKINSASNFNKSKIANYFNTINASVNMDEVRWGIIEKDTLKDKNWGSKDTGDTHADASVYLHNWYLERLQWMNNGIDGHPNSQALSTTNYTIQPPKVTTDKQSYTAGEDVTLTITDITGGDYTYTIYKDGVELATGVTQKTYTFTADKSGTYSYTVKATSNTGKYATSAPVEITITGANLEITIDAPETAMVGDTLNIKVISNAASLSNVTDLSYKLTYVTQDGTQEPVNTTGEFSVPVTSGMVHSAYTFTAQVSATVNGTPKSVSKDFAVNISAYEMTLTVKAPGSVEVGSAVTITAKANSNSEVTYKLFEITGDEEKLLAENTNGVFTVDIPNDAKVGSTKSFKVVASTTVEGQVHSKTSNFSFTVTELKDTYTAVIYFKSADSYGYRPLLTTTGAVNDVARKNMEWHEVICKNVTQTASYSWYKSEELTVSKSSDLLIVNVVSSRYAMEGEITLKMSNYTANDKGVIEVYLACDNLNYNPGGVIRDLTNNANRNWTQSATNMIYDEKEVSAMTYAAVAAMIAPRYIGDVNNDGVVNVKDATLLQKSIAGTATLDADTRYISDVFYDGIISVKDATAIQKRVVNL